MNNALMVQWLLEHGANVDFYSPDYKIIDQTAFLSAGANGFNDILEILSHTHPMFLSVMVMAVML